MVQGHEGDSGSPNSTLTGSRSLRFLLVRREFSRGPLACRIYCSPRSQKTRRKDALEMPGRIAAAVISKGTSLDLYAFRFRTTLRPF